MTDISKDDEREAREWLAMIMRSHSTYQCEPDIASTLLALLDRPVMPKPEEVPDDVRARMAAAYEAAKKYNPDPYGTPMMAALQVHHDHYTAPPKPAKVEAWAVVWADGHRTAFTYRQDAETCVANGPKSAPGRIVRLVEADSHE